MHAVKKAYMPPVAARLASMSGVERWDRRGWASPFGLCPFSHHAHHASWFQGFCPCVDCSFLAHYSLCPAHACIKYRTVTTMTAINVDVIACHIGDTGCHHAFDRLCMFPSLQMQSVVVTLETPPPYVRCCFQTEVPDWKAPFVFCRITQLLILWLKIIGVCKACMPVCAPAVMHMHARRASPCKRQYQ